MRIPKGLKSKTIDFNLVALSLVWAVSQFGVEMPAEVAVTIVALVNVGLRYLTTGAVQDK